MISFTKVFISTILFIGGSFFIPKLAGAGDTNVQVPFNAGDVIEQVSHYPNFLGHLEGRKAIESGPGWGMKSGEVILDTNVAYVMAPNDQMGSCVAFDGTNYLVVWSDQRAWSSDIYAARVRPDGVVIDTAGIAILGIGIYPAVAFDGTNYLAVWEDYRNGSATDIYGARISPQGRVLDPNGLAISTAALNQWNPSIAFDGTNYLVVWDDRRNGANNGDIYGARVSPSGAVIDTVGIPISLAPSYQTFPSVAYDGANFVAVWMDRRSGSSNDIYGARISSAGVVLDTAGIAISTGGYNRYYPGIGTDGTNTLVAWGDYRSGTSVDLYGTRINRSGVVLDSAGFPISTAPVTQWHPSIAYDGVNYLVMWEDARNTPNRGVYGARVTPAGVVLDPNGIAIYTSVGNQLSPRLAFDGTNYLVTWDKWPTNSDQNIFCARITTGGAVLDTAGIAVSKAAYWQSNPSVSYGGGNFLTVWEDYRRGSYSQSDIYGARMSGSGQVLDPIAIPISTAANSQYEPAVAFDGTNWLVVWTDLSRSSYGDIYGARISSAGVVLDPAGFAISTADGIQGSPAVAFDGADYLVVWADCRNSDSSDIYGARVSPGGTVLDPFGIPISTAIGSQTSPAVAFDGTNYLVVWQDNRINGYYYDIFGARIRPDGAVIDTLGFSISTAESSQDVPTVTFGGANYLVAWEDRRNGEERDIYGCRVSPSGAVLDTVGIAICTEPGNQMMPAVTLDSTDYVVVWSDTRSGVAYDLYGAKVNSGGAVIDTFAASLQPGNQIYPAVASGPASQWMLAYAGFADSINRRSANTIRIWGKVYPLSGVNREEGIGSINPRPSLQVYPNPFREKAWVSANVPGRLKVYDALGRLVREFPKEAAKPGPLGWEGTDGHGRRLPGGVYFLRYDYGTGCETRKVVLLR